MKTKRLPVGISDFKDIISGNYLYVDKSLFVQEILDRGDKILLIPRPRRFGKTLNLSMLKYFFDCCPATGNIVADSDDGSALSNHALFNSLAISKAGDEYMNQLGNHPVIFLSFRSIKDNNWKTCINKLKQLIRKEYLKHKYVLDSPLLDEVEKVYFNRILHMEDNEGDYENSLESLLIFLNRYYKKRVVILIDEYDAPVHAGFSFDYYDQVINFMRNFLSGGLKDMDQYLEKSVITGIMRIGKESIFSGLNNPGVYTLTRDEFDQRFGFTEPEVEKLLTDFQLLGRYDDVKEWYNGYRFGSRVVYNPWSIINFIASDKKVLEPYWVNTSHNKIIDSLLYSGGKELKLELEQLIRGESIEKAIDENIVLAEVGNREELLWSFLLMGGYLKQKKKEKDELSTEVYYELSIPNLEIKSIYKRIIKQFFSDRIENSKLKEMLKALVNGEIDIFEEIFSDYVVKSMSFFDTEGDPEKIYHAFVMGLLLWLAPGYRVKSNRESGYGRYDITIIPEDVSRLGYIIEFKKVRKKETVETALKSALKQIKEKKYETELLENGVENYKSLAIVFNGKDVTIKEA